MIYRVAATVQIVLVLAIITLYSGCMMDAIYIIILAIMNDLTMMPLSSDRQKARTLEPQAESGPHVADS